MTGKTIPEEWQQLLEEYQQRVNKARSMGGPSKLEKRHNTGRLNAREFIDLLTDPGSFMELGSLVGALSWSDLPPAPADALVGGLARVGGHEVILAVEDFTVQGGSIGHGTNAKRLRLATLALKQKLPYILVLDGAGARMTNSLERHPYAPSDLQVLARLKGQVPTIACILGSSAGHGALTGVMMDLVVMLESASLFSAGPPLVAAALGKIVTKEELGGAMMHTTHSGVAHNRVADEKTAATVIHNWLGLLLDRETKPEKTLEGSILEVVPRNSQQPYDIKKVIGLVADSGHLLEYQPGYGKTMVTGLARIAGISCAIIANQPNHMAGAIDYQGARKATEFLKVVNSHTLPVLFLADNPGIMSGFQAERDGTLKAAAEMYLAQSQVRGKKIHVTLRKAYGFGSSVMGMNPMDNQTLTLAFPGISLGGIPALGGSDAARVDENTAEQLAQVEASGSWTASDNMAYDEIIDPRDLRKHLCRAINL